MYTNVIIMKLEEAVKRRRKKNENYYLLEGWARKKINRKSVTNIMAILLEGV
jgi:hypothetical protein